jgi:CO/xanthine dehydrogenase Mo-binding subunit
VLAIDNVRFIGEPVALIAAETEAIAEAALRLIEIEFEATPGIFDPEDGLRPGAPILHEPDNKVGKWKILKGDLERGFAEADVVVENTFRVPYQDHAYIEPEAGVGWLDSQGVINLRVSTQVIEHFRSVAKALGVPQNKIRVQGTFVGGGFGGKEDITVEIFLALLVQATGRPVRLVYTREESILAHSKRHPMVITHRTGVRLSGKITASHIRIVADSGAYPYLSPYVLLYSAIMAPGPYAIGNLFVDAVAVATNNPFTSAFRGFGGPQAAFAYESQMDRIAEALGMDCLELRRLNYLCTGDTTSTGQPIETAAWLEETATRALAALGEKTAPGAEHIRVGQGFSSYFQSYGRITWLHDTSQAWVGMELDGTVVVRAGVPDLGAGQVNSLAQIAAEVLGVPLNRVTIYHTDTALTPLSGTSTATRQLYMSGNATLKAATAVRNVLVTRASQLLEEEPEKIDLADGMAFVTRSSSGPKSEAECVPLADLVRRCAAEGLPLANLALFQAPFSDPLDPETGQGHVFPDFTFGAMACEVAVDVETGEVTLLKAVTCHDVGRAINRTAAEGQLAGGANQGLGYALLEDMRVKEGRIQTPSLTEYLLPTSMDFPPVQVILLESGTGVGPFGAKGIGEPSLTPAAPAVASAVSDAIGKPVYELPLTPERVLKVIRS